MTQVQVGSDGPTCSLQQSIKMISNKMNRSTKTMKAVEANMTLTECCEVDCRMTIMVEKEEMNQGRKTRCMACVMKAKLGKIK